MCSIWCECRWAGVKNLIMIMMVSGVSNCRVHTYLRSQIENEKTQLQISEQEQKVAQKRAETKRKEANIRAQAELEVAEIQLQIQVANKEAK